MTLLLVILTITLLGCGALGFVLLWRRSGRLHDQALAHTRALLLNEFRQIEALLGLYQLLRLDGPLPPTRQWAGSPDFLLAIARHARDRRPATVVECGSGVSTLVLARCAQLNGEGHVYALEHDRHFAERTRRALHEHDLESCATVIDAPLVACAADDTGSEWYALDGLPAVPIDLLVIDGPPAGQHPTIRYPAGPMLFPRMAPGAVCLLDDAIRPGEQEVVARWSRAHAQLHLDTIGTEKGLVRLEWPA